MIKITIRIMHSYLPECSPGRAIDLILHSYWYSRFYCRNPPARKVSHSTAWWSSNPTFDRATYFENAIYSALPGECEGIQFNIRKSLFWSKMKHIWSCLLKVKSALVNVNRTECSLKPIHLGVNWFSLLSRVKIVYAVSAGKSAYRGWKLLTQPSISKIKVV